MPYFSPDQLKLELAQKLNLPPSEVTNEIAESFFRDQIGLLDQPPADPNYALTPPVVFDIFLSYSSLDSVSVAGIYTYLTGIGYKVYLDSINDPQLSKSSVTLTTSRTLRYRMAQCKSLFVCTSKQTTVSKWVPWELGWADGWRNKAAVLPITDEVTFTRQEYFELYPEVSYSPGNSKGQDLILKDFNGSSQSWIRWISSNRLW